jgi:hypothetical protein
MKRANDLERRVKGFRIPDAWDVHRDDRLVTGTATGRTRHDLSFSHHLYTIHFD